MIKTAREIEKMRRAGGIVRQLLEAVRPHVKAGATTMDLEVVAAGKFNDMGVTPSFKGYKGYPCVLCTSINSEVVHGIPSTKRVLQQGDIVSIDTGVVIEGFYGDSAMTVAVGDLPAVAQQLLDTTQASLARGIEVVRIGATLGDIGAAVQEVVEKDGFSVVREFVGHGIGTRLHEDPQVPNYGTRGKGLKLREGMVFCIEPMVNSGKPDVQVLKDGWTAVTADGSLSAHFEHTVAVTNHGVQVLTQ